LACVEFVVGVYARQFVSLISPISYIVDTCFGAFFNHPHLAPIFHKFYVVHIVAPGHDDNAESFAADYVPTFDSMVEQIEAVSNRLLLCVLCIFLSSAKHFLRKFLRLALSLSLSRT
jgi:hypothetical protein